MPSLQVNSILTVHNLREVYQVLKAAIQLPTEKTYKSQLCNLQRKALSIKNIIKLQHKILSFILITSPAQEYLVLKICNMRQVIHIEWNKLEMHR